MLLYCVNYYDGQGILSLDMVLFSREGHVPRNLPVLYKVSFMMMSLAFKSEKLRASDIFHFLGC